jgi:predicted RNase H-like nuclease (RuvC/YqgF family)
MDLLPATAEVTTTLPHNALLSNAILIVYASILLTAVYRSHRRVSGLETARLEDALTDRDQAAQRTIEIEAELEKTRSRLSEIEPIEREHSEEIDQLQSEREALHRQLATLAAREESLRGRADRAVELAQEVRAMEDLLEEATGDLDSKNEEIGRLESTLKKASKSAGKAKPAKAKTADLLAKRFRTLYKTIEVDERAISDIAGLGDASLRLKAEESVKRLADEADNVAIRRKVGGLPDHVQVFELGFAGKGRIYYTRGKARRFRILCVGAKNTQDADLEYLSRLPREEFS